jgi:hypothetical protein
MSSILDRLNATLRDLISWKPCYGWTEQRIYEFAQGKEEWTAKEILELELSDRDKLWLVLRPELLPDLTLHHASCDFAEHCVETWNVTSSQNQRVTQVLDAKRAWMFGADNEKGLIESRVQLRTLSISRTRLGYEAAHAVYCAAWITEQSRESGEHMAWWTAEAASRSLQDARPERKWQVDHLRTLIT